MTCCLCGDGSGLSESCPCCGAQAVAQGDARRAWAEGVEALEAVGLVAPGLSYRGGVARVMVAGRSVVAVEDADKATAYREATALALRLAADEVAA